MYKDRKFSAKSWDKLLNKLTTKINLGITDLFLLTGHRYMALITDTRIFIASSSLEITNGGYKAIIFREYPAKGKYLRGYRLLRTPIACRITWKEKGEPVYQFSELPGRCRVKIRYRKRYFKGY